MEQDVVVLDKDYTVTDEEDRIFPAVKEFLEQQRAQNRRLIMATAGSETETNKRYVREIADCFEDFFGRERLWAENIYLQSDGTPRKLRGAYSSLIASRKRKIRRYENPYCARRGKDGSYTYLKDIHLLRRYLAPKDFEQIRMALISDIPDILNVSSDPETPLILVPPDGSWTQRSFVDRLLDILFANHSRAPSAVFDELIAGGKSLQAGHEVLESTMYTGFGIQAVSIQSVRKAMVNIFEQPFILTKTKEEGRIIFESPVV